MTSGSPHEGLFFKIINMSRDVPQTLNHPLKEEALREVEPEPSVFTVWVVDLARGQGFEQDSGTNTSLYREPYKTQTRSAHNLKIKEINVVLKKTKVGVAGGWRPAGPAGGSIQRVQSRLITNNLQQSNIRAERRSVTSKASPVIIRLTLFQSEASDWFSFSDVI